MQRKITGHTGLLGLIGSPVGHSGSPAMYNYSFEKWGLDSVYLAFDVLEENVGEAIAAMRTFHMRGMNVTMPCKAAVIPYMDTLSPAAKLIGAVNTIVQENGQLQGHNTDGVGFVRNLKEHGISVEGKRLVVIGAGGAATAIVVQAALDGAAAITVFNVQDSFFKKGEEMIQRVAQAVPGCTLAMADLDDPFLFSSHMHQCDILINATKLGMKPQEETSPVKDAALFRPGLTVADTVYNPKETRLLKEAAFAGCSTVGGIGMLLWQGHAAFQLYTGKEMPVLEVAKLLEI